MFRLQVAYNTIDLFTFSCKNILMGYLLQLSSLFHEVTLLQNPFHLNDRNACNAEARELATNYGCNNIVKSRCKFVDFEPGTK